MLTHDNCRHNLQHGLGCDKSGMPPFAREGKYRPHNKNHLSLVVRIFTGNWMVFKTLPASHPSKYMGKSDDKLKTHANALFLGAYIGGFKIHFFLEIRL